MRRRVTVRRALATALAAFALLAISGCADGGAERERTAEPEGVVIEEFVVPSEPDLSAPEPAVRSYLDWVTFAYRMANSQLATQTVAGYQYVRVDAYVQRNRTEGVALYQELLDFRVRATGEGPADARGVEPGTPTAIVAASEQWRFRYFSLETLLFTTGFEFVSYETTYTVARVDGRWRVIDVQVATLDQQGR